MNISRDPSTGGVLLTKTTGNFDDFFRMRDALTQQERDEFVLPGRERSPVRLPKFAR